MKCRYEFAVSSSVLLLSPLKFEFGRYRFELHDEEKRFSRLVVETDGVQFKEYPRVENNKEERSHFKIPVDPAMVFLEPEIRAVRGALSMWGVHDIDVENSKSSWQPETEDEKRSTSIFGASMSKQSIEDEPPREFPLDMLIRSLVSRERLVEYEIPFEFYRRGAEDIYRERYIEAIYDFYFVLEYLWGNGKFRKREVVSQFMASPQAVASVEFARNNPPAAVASHKSDLELYRSSYYEKTIEEIFEQIVDLRGFLHHQSSTRNKNWNPNTDRKFRVHSYFLQIVAHDSVSKIFIGILFDEEEGEKFKTTKVYTKDNKLVNWVPIEG